MGRIKALGICLTAASLSLPAAAADLLEIYQEAYLQDTAIQQAKAMRDYYRTGIDAATAELLPQLDVVGSLGLAHTDVKGDGNRADNRSAALGLSLSQVIWRHSSWIGRSIASKQAVRYDLAYQDALQGLIVRVSEAYFAVLNAADTLEFQQANNAAVKRQLDEANRQFQVGLIAETDRLEAQAAYDLSDAAVIAADNALSNSYENIRALTGHPVTVGDLVPLRVDKFDAPAVSQALADLLRTAEDNNLLLQQYAVARDVARDQISLAQTGHEPVVTFTADAQTGYTDYSHESPAAGRSDGNAWTQSLGINAAVPLYHGGATVAAVSQAESNYVYACQELEARHRSLMTDVNNGYHNVGAAVSSVRAYAQSVKSARSALDATQAGYEVGTRTMTDVLDATQRLYNALQQSAQSRYDYILSRLRLKYTDGSLKLEHLEQINAGLGKRPAQP